MVSAKLNWILTLTKLKMSWVFTRANGLQNAVLLHHLLQQNTEGVNGQRV